MLSRQSAFDETYGAIRMGSGAGGGGGGGAALLVGEGQPYELPRGCSSLRAEGGEVAETLAYDMTETLSGGEAGVESLLPSDTVLYSWGRLDLGTLFTDQTEGDMIARPQRSRYR